MAGIRHDQLKGPRTGFSNIRARNPCLAPFFILAKPIFPWKRPSAQAILDPN
jgi:hypothetical protein